MERNIPDVRDIFGRGDSAPKQKQQELRTYDYSPRSRRRHEAMDSYDHRLPPDTNPRTTKERKPRHRTTDDPEPRKKSQQDGDGKGKDAAYYNNRTLTERDIRHLERHLSMKKTIRKQISRNLAQAFVDDPDLAMTEPPPKSKTQPDRSFTLTRAKVSKSEQNVLDLLKDNEPDSGHCSADNPNSSDDDSHHQEHVRRVKEKASHNSNSRSVQKPDVGYKDDGKFSFWKMFSVKNRGKR